MQIKRWRSLVQIWPIFIFVLVQIVIVISKQSLEGVMSSVAAPTYMYGMCIPLFQYIRQHPSVEIVKNFA